jgi:hypothetical protein
LFFLFLEMGGCNGSLLLQLLLEKASHWHAQLFAGAKAKEGRTHQEGQAKDGHTIRQHRVSSLCVSSSLEHTMET